MASNTTSVPIALPPAMMLDSTSDDEESFVVLGTSLPPSPSTTVIDTTIVDEALNLVHEHLSHFSDSTSSFPSMPKVTEQDLAQLTEKLNLSIITTNTSVDLSPDEIQQKVDVLVEENIKLKETLHQNNLAMKNQYETLVLWQEDVMKVHQSHKEKFAETKKYIENLKIENAQLTQALALEQLKTKELTDDVTKRSDDLINTNMTEFALENALKKIASYETEIKQLQAEKSILEKSSAQTVQNDEELQKYKTELDNCKVESSNYCSQLRQYESLQKILLDEIKMLKANHSQCIKQEVSDNVQEQLMAAQMHITNLELVKNQDKETINDAQTKITQLESEIQEYKDTMTALRTQLELYKSDFEAEHQLRTNLNISKDQLAEDLQQLQRRNNQLLEEVERLRRNEFVYVKQESASAAASAPAPADVSKWACPKCSFKFSDYQTLENHVYRCIEIDSLF